MSSIFKLSSGTSVTLSTKCVTLFEVTKSVNSDKLRKHDETQFGRIGCFVEATTHLHYSSFEKCIRTPSPLDRV